MKQLLVVVDYQKDFVDGALGFEDAQALEDGILKAIFATLAQDGYVLFTRDTHGADYLETREGKYLPAPHCIVGSAGHELYGRLHTFETDPQPHTAMLDKPTFGSPDIGDSATALCGGAPDVVTVCGVVTDICVIANTLALHAALPLANIQVDAALCGSGNEANAKKALDVLQGMGIAMLNQM